MRTRRSNLRVFRPSSEPSRRWNSFVSEFACLKTSPKEPSPKSCRSYGKSWPHMIRRSKLWEISLKSQKMSTAYLLALKYWETCISTKPSNVSTSLLKISRINWTLNQMKQFCRWSDRLSQISTHWMMATWKDWQNSKLSLTSWAKELSLPR
jgi:hypothetical protein